MKLRRCTVALAVAALASVGVTLGTGVAQATALSFGASADTFVNSASANSSFGTNALLRANTGSNTKISYVKFVVSGIPVGDTVSSAVLTLTATADAQPADTLRVYNVPNTWTETTTYNTRPTLGTLIGTAPISGPGVAVSIGVPVSGNGTFSFAVTDTTVSNGDNVLASRENGTTAARPKLTVTHGAPNVAPTVSAGADQTVTLPAGASLDGTVTDDGRPSGTLTQTWSKVSGPGTVTFGNSSAVDTTATFSVAGSYVLRLTASDGALSSSDDATVTVNAAGPVFPPCPGTVVRPFPSGTTLTAQYKVDSPGDSTYEFDGVTSTAYPATGSPYAFGTVTPPADLCMNDGAVAGTTDDSLGWRYYHDTWNASCVKIVATHTIQVNRLNCHDIEDGLRFLENNNSVGNANTTTFYSSGVWLDRVRDDCIENDFTLGGVLYDSLWERCNTGISERPASGNGTWTSPAGETVTLDHMLVGLWETWHEADGRSGENALFKWSTSANHLVIKCSIFKVDSVSLNGASANDIPAGTVVDDSACPGNPSKIVWLGAGAYPGNLNGSGLTVSTNVADWNTAVAAWKTAHGY